MQPFGSGAVGEGINFKIEPKTWPTLHLERRRTRCIFLFLAENGQNSLVLVDKRSIILGSPKMCKCSLGKIIKLDYFSKDFDSEHLHILGLHSVGHIFCE